MPLELRDYNMAVMMGATVDGSSIEDGSIDKADLDTDIQPEAVVKFEGRETTTGGAADEDITVTGMLATDLAQVEIVDNGTNNVTILEVVPKADRISVTYSADPSSDTVVDYTVERPT